MDNEFLLYTAVSQLAVQTKAFSDNDLGQPYKWRKHDEGVRLAFLGTYHELRDLAVVLSQKRIEGGLPETAVQRTLAQNHLGFRDLQAVFLAASDEIYDQKPAVGEWNLRTVLLHIVDAERAFFALAHVGLESFRRQESPPSFPEDAIEKLFGPNETFWEIADEGTLADLFAYYEQIHFRSWDMFAAISNDEATAPSPLWWEEETYSIEYRLRRMDIHLRQHLIQAEKTLETLDHAPNEALRLLRQLYHALAEVEGLLIGAPNLCLAERQALAETIQQRTRDICEVVANTQELETAVKSGDTQTIKTLLEHHPSLANAKDSSGLPLILTALYHQKPEVATQLVKHDAHLSIHSAAAYGDLAKVQEHIAEWDGWINVVAKDGFTPLQLACFFNREDVALWLIEQGADVTAVAQNGMRIQPLHAACAANNITIVTALLENGADVNARQANDFTPLHTAADNNSPELALLLLRHGADKTAVTTTGQTPYDWAVERGNDDVLHSLTYPS